MSQTWVWLLIAFIVGMLIEWLLEIFFFRRRILRQTQETVLAVERSNQDLQAKIATLEAALRERDIELGNLKAQISRVQGERDACADTRSALNKQVESLQAQLDKTKTELGVSLGANVGLEKELGALQAQLSKAKVELDAAQKGKAACEADARTRQSQLDKVRGDLADCQKRTSDLWTDVQKLQASATAAAERVKGLESEQARQRRQIEKSLSDLLQVANARDRLTAENAQLRAQPPVTPTPDLAFQQLRRRSADDETPFVAACPQHLSDVKGIGTVYEQRLYEAGIGSYWELA